ncbi:MAG: amidase [Rhizobiales bacterium]|nr:amidase [Hyphomicrobiales bacterium]
MNLAELSIQEAGGMLRDGSITSQDLTLDALDRISAGDGSIHAFIRIDRNAALTAARQADSELRSGIDRGDLHGIPYGLKDIFDARGWPTTCGSRICDGIAASDSAVVERLQAAGAILLGKLATFEFAIGGPSLELPWPPARNPWDSSRQTGGSSSGSAAAIAAGYTRLTIGSCTAGSIRGPAAWCGAVGLKPTFGLVSRRGCHPLAPSLDHCGPLTRNVHDSAIALQALAGRDTLDPASADVPPRTYTSDLEKGVAGLRIGVPRAFFESAPNLSDDARRGIENTLSALAGQGARIRTVTLPPFGTFLSCVRVIMAYEMYAMHRTHLRGRLDDLATLTTVRFLAGLAVDPEDYRLALKLQRWLTTEVDRALAEFDGFVTAISLDTAPLVEDLVQPLGWPLQASPFNLTGHPAMSVPIGLDQNGMPLAVQVIGRRFDEATVLQVGRAIERSSGWEQIPLPATIRRRDRPTGADAGAPQAKSLSDLPDRTAEPR